MKAAARTVRAAGGVVTRGDGSVLLVHRPRYDDWTLPKGKHEAGESDEQTALREVAEETGCECTLGRELPTISYVDNMRRPKTVRYWAMTVETEHPRQPDDEVDRTEWMTLDRARDTLTYDRDVEVLDAFADSAS